VRILVYEFVTGGGLAGRPVPRSLAREGLAMRSALLEDLAALRGHSIVATTDPRFTRPVPRGVELVSNVGRALSGSPGGPRGGAVTRPTIEGIDWLVNECDAVWLIAPETDRCLERLAARVERSGKILLGSGAGVVRMAADKSRLPRRLARVGIGHPETSVLTPGVNARIAARRLGYPVVVKPARGAGCRGVRLAHHAWELAAAIDAAHHANGTGLGRRSSKSEGGPGHRSPKSDGALGHRSSKSEGDLLVMQRYVRGRAASVSLLADGDRAVPLAVNAQRVTAGPAFVYRGGSTPLEHPIAAAAADAATRACAAIPGLRGYVGVDLVLTDAGPVVIEVNPRLTMAYLGVRAVLDENVAALALAACDGRLPSPTVAQRRARFTAAGRVLS
jgi:predicted ATP-grasp superfamily ATP-dependent carboligase